MQMNLFNWFVKIKRYLYEIKICCKMGYRLRNKIALAVATLQFHISNGTSFSMLATQASNSYQIKLGDEILTMRLRKYSGDFFIFHEIFGDRCYQISDDLLKTADIVIDLGANIGLTTIFFSQRFPQSRFICVEPDMNNLRLLRENTLFLGSRVCIIEGSVSVDSGFTNFVESRYSWGGKTEGAQLTRGRRVRSLTVNEIMEMGNTNVVDVLKIDIEGTEAAIFKNKPTWLEKVRVIIIELHGDYSEQLFEADLGELFFVLPHHKVGNRMTLALSRKHFTSAKFMNCH